MTSKAAKAARMLPSTTQMRPNQASNRIASECVSSFIEGTSSLTLGTRSIGESPLIVHAACPAPRRITA